MKGRLLQRTLSDLITDVQAMGMNDEVIDRMWEFLHEDEFGVCLEYIAEMVNDLDSGITPEFYDQISKAAYLMGLPESSYIFLRRLQL